MSKTLLLLIFSILHFSVYCQTSVDGTYVYEFEGSNASIRRTLILNPDKTFLFHAYEYHEKGIPPEKNIYGKGTWESKKSLVYFTTSKADIDDKHTLDFSNSKARFDAKSPRDKSGKEIKTSLRFYESEVFWVKGMKLIKQ